MSNKVIRNTKTQEVVSRDALMLLRRIINIDGEININDTDMASEATALLIQNAVDILADTVTSGSVNVVLGTPSIETPSKTTVSTSGSVTTGVKSVTFITDSSFTGTILGDTAQANGAYTFSASLNNTLSALVYTVTAGSMEITEVR